MAAVIIPITDEYQVPFFVLSSAADDLTDEPAPFHFRVGPANYQDSDAIAQLPADKGFSRPGLIYGSLPSLTDGGWVLRTVSQMGMTMLVIAPHSGLLKIMRDMAGEAGNGMLIPNTVDPGRADVAAFFAELNSRLGKYQPTLWPVLRYYVGNIVIEALADANVQAALAANDLPAACIALRDAVEQIGTFKGLQGHEGADYTFATGKHRGPPDENWFTFVQVTDNGATLIKPDLSQLAPR